MTKNLQTAIKKRRFIHLNIRDDKTGFQTNGWMPNLDQHLRENNIDPLEYWGVTRVIVQVQGITWYECNNAANLGVHYETLFVIETDKEIIYGVSRSKADEMPALPMIDNIS